VNEDDIASADDIDQFVTRMILLPPPPPINSDITAYNDVIVTSAGGGHVTSIHRTTNNGCDAPSYHSRAGSIDKTTDLYVNLPTQRPKNDLPPSPRSLAQHCSTEPCHYACSVGPSTDARLQTTVNDAGRHCQYQRRPLRWYDALFDGDTTRHNVAVCRTSSLRSTSPQRQ